MPRGHAGGEQVPRALELVLQFAPDLLDRRLRRDVDDRQQL
jgi:hypothetical protein